MRVTAGLFKGRPLVENKYEHIRPTADMVKQALFNKLAFQISDAVVLDLFCGTGALGIEAISRGAKEVVFVDKDFRSVALTKENLRKLGINAEVYKGHCINALKLFKAQNKIFDIIILDPPYKSNLYEICVDEIYKLGLLKKDGLIICEMNKEDNFEFKNFQIVDEKRYGIKKLCYLQHFDK